MRPTTREQRIAGTYQNAGLTTQSILTLLDMDIPPAYRSGHYHNARRHLLVALQELQEAEQLIRQAAEQPVSAEAGA